jgi:hypothetical protein
MRQTAKSWNCPNLAEQGAKVPARLSTEEEFGVPADGDLGLNCA